ncbi:MAG: hypothetical protein Q7J79_04030 [Gemmatimonadales bacterium]|nr:hypothetical protein [Gemmatimonadales bacterium]
MTKAMFGLCAAAWLAFPAQAARAQSGDEPNLIFSITGGYMGGGRLWSVEKQAIAAPAGQFDTLALARRLRPGFSVVLGGTFFGSAHLGVGLEVALFALGSESRCAPRDSFRTDPQRLNEQTCVSIQGKHIPTSMVAFQGGLTYQFGDRLGAQPYLRAGGGLAILGNSFVQTTAEVVSNNCPTGCSVLVLDASKRREFVWTATLAAGVALPMGPGYRFRAEVRDGITALPVVTGPANPLSTTLFAETSTSVRHLFSLTFGIDVLLERRRTRRY